MELKGTITRKHLLPTPDEKGGILGALEVRGSSDHGSPDAEVTITRSTRWLSAHAQPAGPVTLEQVREGERVIVLFGEGVQETYPVRGVAVRVTLLDGEHSSCKSR